MRPKNEGMTFFTPIRWKINDNENNHEAKGQKRRKWKKKTFADTI